MKHLIFFAAVGGIAMTVLFALRAPAPPEPDSSVQWQTQEADGVSVTVVPSIDEDTLVVEVALDTHAGDLGVDLAAASVLKTASGEKMFPRSWEGDPPGGHHRSGRLLFDLPGSSAILVIQDIGSVGRSLEFPIAI